MAPRRRCAFTLAEMLVVISIIGILMAILLPAIQAVRERANRLRCENNLRQIGIAAHSHHDTHGHFPGSGWGDNWAGDPDMGYGHRQPGSWVYNLLPFIEQGNLREWGLGYGTDEPDLYKPATAHLTTFALALLHCPSRRSAVRVSQRLPDNGINADQVDETARGDYAACAGSLPGSVDSSGDVVEHLYAGPESWWLGLNHDLVWPAWSRQMNGTSFLHSKVTEAMIHDGSSFTYLFGEKYLDLDHYNTGNGQGDRRSVYHGYGLHVNRFAIKAGVPGYDPLTADQQRLLDHFGDLAPLPDSRGVASGAWRFGSAHPTVCQFVFADGHVAGIGFDIDPYVHYRLADRRDRIPIDAAELE